VLPPILAIGLALITKEVITSLTLGVLSGAFIYACYTAGGVMSVITQTFNISISYMSECFGGNAAMVIFLALLGALVAVITMAGGSRAYGEWAASKVKSRSMAQIATSALGFLIFIDDYFNCLTVGTVMRPVTDKYSISHEKLAYIIDATAAPVCIIAPISSWAASVISYMSDTGLDGMTAFVQSIPYNLYAMLTIIMVIVLSVTNLEFGPMAKYERLASEHGVTSTDGAPAEELDGLQISSKGKVMDLIVPIAVLIVLSIFAMIYVGGYFDGGMTLFDAFGNTDAGPALALAAFVTLIFTFFFFVLRGVLTLKQFTSGIGVGVKTMVPAIIILCLAWTLSGMCRYLLSTGQYVGALVEASSMPPALIPAIIFVVAAALSFSMGTSWGTFGILIPIIAVVCETVAPQLTIISLSATLAGSVFGDHCSPISDTTILSSAGANCAHINHVSSQIPYCLLVAVCCFFGYIVAGFTANVILTLLVSVVLLVIALVIMHRMTVSKAASTVKAAEQKA